MTPSKPLALFCTVDVRAPAAAGPVERILEVLERLPRGYKAILLAAGEPRELYRIFSANGFDYRSRYVPGGWFEVSVWHAVDTAAASAELE